LSSSPVSALALAAATAAVAAVAVLVVPRLADAFALPVLVTVVGEGAPVRVQVVAAARTAPCDDIGHKRLFDGKIPVGGSVELVSPWACVCWRQTHGHFRDTDFGAHQLVCWTGSQPPPLRIVAVADRPR
jgi:hypothetical protein